MGIGAYNSGLSLAEVQPKNTWPERDFAAFDIFMCGSAQPEAALPILEKAFAPQAVKISENLRGIRDDA